jgi:parallel beta-helix repeat protein
MRRILAVGFVLVVLVSAARAGTYYVATDGKPDNNGSHEKPWPSVNMALEKVGGGNTIVVLPGEYRDPIFIKDAYSGTEQSPTVIRSEEKWKAVFVGATAANISSGDRVKWLTIDGLESFGARSLGIVLHGSHLTVRNCWLHHNCWVGLGMGWDDLLIENNLIEFNGGHVQFDHGIYANGDRLTIRGNIVRHNSSYGLHLYDHLTNSLIANNLVYGNNRAGIIACPKGGGHNRILNNTLVGPLDIWNPGDDLVANNILVADHDPIGKGWRADYNLCWPTRSNNDGPHGISADPGFLAAGMGVYWLKKDSPAIGKGSMEYALPTDFWGRPRPKGQPPDLGAFTYEPSLLEPQTRAAWHCGWGYGRVPGLGLFALPQPQPDQGRPKEPPSSGKP